MLKLNSLELTVGSTAKMSAIAESSLTDIPCLGKILLGADGVGLFFPPVGVVLVSDSVASISNLTV
jgi:hypothetical protein